MPIEAHIPLLEDILGPWQNHIGRDYAGYRNHVYRMINFCLALHDCNEALRMLPDQPEVLDSRALAYWQLGETGKARADLARAREIDPGLPTPEDRFDQFEEMFR